MLTKEAKKKAEAIRQEFAPLFGKGEELAKTYQKATAKSSALYRDWFAWSSVGTSGHAAETWGKEKAEQMEQLRHTNPKEWHRLEREARAKYEQAAERSKVAEINAKNWIAYTAEKLRARVSQDLDTFAPRGGLVSLGECLHRNEWAGQPLGVSFSLWCGSLHEVRITQQAGGIGATNWEAQSINEPQPLTVAKLHATKRKIKRLKEQAERIKDESREIVRAAGLLGVVPFIIQIKTSL